MLPRACTIELVCGGNVAPPDGGKGVEVAPIALNEGRRGIEGRRGFMLAPSLVLPPGLANGSIEERLIDLIGGLGLAP